MQSRILRITTALFFVDQLLRHPHVPCPAFRKISLHFERIFSSSSSRGRGRFVNCLSIDWLSHQIKFNLFSINWIYFQKFVRSLDRKCLNIVTQAWAGFAHFLGCETMLIVFLGRFNRKSICFAFSSISLCSASPTPVYPNVLWFVLFYF